MKASLALCAYLAAILIATVHAHAAGNSNASPNALVRAFHCIHSHEGSWTDPGAPYYGGLQMDYGFMSTYGAEYLRAWGTADHWPPSVQIAVAIRAYLSGRGFGPWPNTARMCGLY